MNNDFEVIAAFLDGERVDTEHLRLALASEGGRQHLVDVVALREVAGDESVTPVLAPTTATFARRPVMRWMAMAPAVLLAIAGGYAAGFSRAQTDVPAQGVSQSAAVPDTTPPKPTIVIKLKPGATWKERDRGGQP